MQRLKISSHVLMVCSEHPFPPNTPPNVDKLILTTLFIHHFGDEGNKRTKGKFVANVSPDGLVGKVGRINSLPYCLLAFNFRYS